MKPSSSGLAATFLGISIIATSGPTSMTASAEESAGPFAKINHFLIIYTENRSLDNLFGQFPGADNIASAKDFPPQVDFDGSVLKKLPLARIGGKIDGRFPADLPNAPFEINRYVAASDKTGDLVHKFYQEQEQIDGGRHRFIWAARNVRPPKREVFAPDSSIPSMSIRVGSPLAWSDIGRWYNGLSKDRYVLTTALAATVDSIVRGARSADERLTALHRVPCNSCNDATHLTPVTT